MTEEKNTPYANSVFEQPWWLDIVAPGKWGEAIVRDGEQVVARLPYVCDHGKIKNPVYTQTLGIWMSEELRQPKRGNEHLARQKETIHKLLEQLPVKRGIDFILDSSQEYILPFRWEGYSIEPTFSYRYHSIEASDLLEKNYGKNIKRDLNRGKKTLFVQETDAIEEFIELQNLTFRKQGRKNPIENDFTFHVIKNVLELNNGKVFIARDNDGKAHAGSFILYDQKVCYHLMSGQNTAFGNDCAMPVLLHKEIEFARKHSNCFDFEGSMIEGIEQTYRRYGGQLVTNWHVSKQRLLSDIADIVKPRVKRLVGYKI